MSCEINRSVSRHENLILSFFLPSYFNKNPISFGVIYQAVVKQTYRKHSKRKQKNSYFLNYQRTGTYLFQLSHNFSSRLHLNVTVSLIKSRERRKTSQFSLEDLLSLWNKVERLLVAIVMQNTLWWTFHFKVLNNNRVFYRVNTMGWCNVISPMALWI